MERRTKMKTMVQTNKNEQKAKRGKKSMMIIVIIVAVIIAFTSIGAILHATYYKGKLEQIKPYGQLVDVDDGQMHVYSIGNGEKTIVLLPGQGVALPSADFGPLMRKLGEKYTVVCVEYFGVGFSSVTSKPRTCQNYVDETRAALSKAGFKAPYVLMPHSISTVFSEYYAETYPDEVEAIISLDGTSTAISGDMNMPAYVKALLPVAKFQQATGSTSLLAPLAVNKKKLLSYGYTEKEVNDSITFTGFVMNDTLFDQIINSVEFIKQTNRLPFPKSVPYFKIISKQTYETKNPQLKMSPEEYQRKHLERIGKHAKYEVLDGSHFIYLNNVDRIAEITDNFLNEIK